MAPPDSNAPPAVRDYDETEEYARDDGARMSFLEHLDELRTRILYSLYAVGAVCAATFYFNGQMMEYLTAYLAEHGGTLIFTRPMGGFMFSMKIAILSGLLVASPFIFSQFWLFVAPGLYAREKKVAIPFVVISTMLFLSGAAFAHVIGYPAMWQFFASYGGETLQFFPDLDVTFGFYMRVILGMGIVFQMPVLVFFLSRFGIVTARFMLRKFKYAVLLIVVVAALITPSGDAVTLGVFATPMLLLYCVSIGVAWLSGRKRTRDDEEAAG